MGVANAKTHHNGGKTVYQLRHKIQLDTNAEFLRCEIKTLPKTIVCKVKENRNYITLFPDLLNPEEKIDITIYYSMSDKLPIITSRIIGGKMLSVNQLNKKEKGNIFIFPMPSLLEDIFLSIMAIWNLLLFFASFFLIFSKSRMTYKEYLLCFLFIICTILTVFFIINCLTNSTW